MDKKANKNRFFASGQGFYGMIFSANRMAAHWGAVRKANGEGRSARTFFK